MPITIRDKQFDREMVREGKRRGGISKTAAVKSLATERLEQIRNGQTQFVPNSTQPIAVNADAI